MPSKPPALVAAFAVWVATNICGAIIFLIVVLSKESTSALDRFSSDLPDMLTGSYFLLVYVFFRSGLLSIPAAMLYIISFWVIAKAPLPWYVAAILLSVLCVVLVYGTLGAVFGTPDQNFYHPVGTIYCSTFVVLNWIAVYAALRRRVEKGHLL